MPDDKPKHKDSLMGELESIKDLLGQDIGSVVPTLEPSVEEADDSQAPLLDLDSIFEKPQQQQPLTLSTNPCDDSPTENNPGADIPTLQAEPEPAVEPPLLEPSEDNNSEADRYTRTPQAVRQQSNFSIDLLIQEIVDDYIPEIEAELRERLSQLDPELIRQLADKKLKP